MVSTEQQVLDELVAGWIELALEYGEGAPGLTAVYIYVSSERGSVFPEIVFEQRGELRYPSDLAGVDTGVDRVRGIHRLQFEDLRLAEGRFAEIGVTPPAEYRVVYDTASRRSSVAISRELIYANDPRRVPEHGPREWLGERLPATF